MSRSISQVLAYRHDEVAAVASSLRADSLACERVTRGIREDCAGALDGLAGESIEAANQVTEQFSRRLFDLGDELCRLADVLEALSVDIDTGRTRILAARDDAESAGCTVHDRGDVDPPRGADGVTIQSARLCEQAIKESLDLVADAEDRTAREILRTPSTPWISLHEENWDPRSAIAGTAIEIQTDPLAGLLKASDPSDAIARNLARGIPVAGTAMGLTIGVVSAPDGEPMTETLVAETIGTGTALVAGAVVAGGVSGAMKGATIGTVVPGVGNAVGAIGGVWIGGLAGYLSAGAVREVFDGIR